MTNHLIKFSMVASFFRDNNSQLQRGENAYSSGHVIANKVIFDRSVQPAFLKGEVRASMKDKSYKVEISIDMEDGILDATCQCPRGQVICHHMAALCIYAHHNFSSTDGSCVWNVPQGVAPERVKSLKEMYPPYNLRYKATGRSATEAEIEKFKSEIKDQVVGFTWYLNEEPTPEHFILPDIEDNLFSKEFIAAADKRTFFLEQCTISEDLRRHVVELTTYQAENEKWLLARKNRLTASNFGAVLSVCQRQRQKPDYAIPVSLLKKLSETYDLSSVKAVQWGRANEKIALQEFSFATGLEVTPTGLWLDTCGFLGASPDGLIGDHSIIEIKCPFRFRDGGLLHYLCSDTKYIIYKTPDHETVINRNHEYWHQIQGQLQITNRQKCFLMVWSPQHTEVVEIERDPGWKENMDILKEFYLRTYIKHICGISLGK